MIPDNKTNFLYLADTLPKYYPGFYLEFEKLLRENKVNFDLLPDTKDVWAVDYMPIQIDLNDFVQFVYKPGYLKSKKDLASISNVDLICEQIGIETTKSEIKIDGGNVTRTKDKVILTERIFKENPTFEKKKLLNELRNYFQVDKLYLIPELPNDFTGHADGMVRFVNDELLLINDFKREDKEFYETFKKAIQNIGLEYLTIPYNPYNNKAFLQANGCYINYLQMENIIVLPTFEIKDDDIVKELFGQIFNGIKIETINCNKIANEGGVLNCITWNIRQ